MEKPFRNEQDEVLFIYRKLVYVLYLEIGALQPGNHPEIAAKADIKNGFFQGEKQKQAAALYHQTENEDSPEAIVAPYVERTSLTLDDIRRAFVEGNWQNKHGGFYFGGPKWIKITQSTLELRRLIKSEEWEEASALVYKIKKLKTNQGYLVNQFEWTERRRP